MKINHGMVDEESGTVRVDIPLRLVVDQLKPGGGRGGYLLTLPGFDSLRGPLGIRVNLEIETEADKDDPLLRFEFTAGVTVMRVVRMRRSILYDHEKLMRAAAMREGVEK